MLYWYVHYKYIFYKYIMSRTNSLQIRVWYLKPLSVFVTKHKKPTHNWRKVVKQKYHWQKEMTKIINRKNSHHNLTLCHAKKSFGNIITNILFNRHKDWSLGDRKSVIKPTLSKLQLSCFLTKNIWYIYLYCIYFRP